MFESKEKGNEEKRCSGDEKSEFKSHRSREIIGLSQVHKRFVFKICFLTLKTQKKENLKKRKSIQSKQVCHMQKYKTPTPPCWHGLHCFNWFLRAGLNALSVPEGNASRRWWMMVAEVASKSSTGTLLNYTGTRRSSVFLSAPLWMWSWGQYTGQPSSEFNLFCLWRFECRLLSERAGGLCVQVSHTRMQSITCTT